MGTRPATNERNAIRAYHLPEHIRQKTGQRTELSTSRAPFPLLVLRNLPARGRLRKTALRTLHDLVQATSASLLCVRSHWNAAGGAFTLFRV